MNRFNDRLRFARFVERICKRYIGIENTEMAGGVRFLYGPASSLNEPNGVVVLGLNPGQEQDMSDRFSQKHTGYYDESWGAGGSSDYQRMVCAIMEKIFIFAGVSDWKSAWDQCLTSNLIPFRSPSLNELANMEELKSFAVDLWQDILIEIAPRAIITFGGIVGRSMLDILREMETNPRLLRTYEARSAAELWAFEGLRGEGRALILPHYAYGHGVRKPSEIVAIAADLAPFMVVDDVEGEPRQARPSGTGQALPREGPRVQLPRTNAIADLEWWERALSRYRRGSWKYDVLAMIPSAETFTADDIFAAHGDQLNELHPGHKNVRGGIAIILTRLATDGMLVRDGRRFSLPTVTDDQCS